MRTLQHIVGGVAQANTGQTTVFNVPPNATYAKFYLKVKTAAGTTPLTDLVLYDCPPEITAAPVVATTTAGDGTHNEVQTVTLTGGPTHGTWTLTWPGVSADTNATTGAIKATSTAAELQELINKALPNTGTYKGEHIVVTRSGSGTSGAPYVYTLTHSGSTVSLRDIDAVTVNGTQLYTWTTDTEAATGNVWNGITQVAGTTASGVTVTVGPGVAAAEDDTGAAYFLNAVLSARMAAKLTFDRGDADELYTYSLWAEFS